MNPDFPQPERNNNQFTKVLIFTFVDGEYEGESDWVAEGSAWWRWAKPVYRKPQSDWSDEAATARKKVYFVSGEGSDPSSVTLPIWFNCYWDSQAGRWVIIQTGGGGGGSMIEFEFSEQEYSEPVSSDCAGRTEGGYDLRVRVINQPCGASVQGMDDEGFINVTDPGDFLKFRDAKDLPGRTGFAMLLGGETDQEYGYSPEGCQWVITWVNFFREVIMVHDIIFQEESILIKRKKLVVWDECDLPDETVQGTDCADEDY